MKLEKNYNNQYRLFSIFGKPVSHSKSPLLHNLTLKTIGENGCYTRYLLENGNNIIKKFRSLGLSGANVTVPYKEDAFRLCDETRGVASKVEAVNTLVLENNRIIGYNTDGEGFYSAIRSISDFQNALIIGAGGTAKAIAFGLKEKNIKIEILNRSKKRLAFFDKHNIKTSIWSDFKFKEFDVVINTTSAGLEDDSLPAPKEILKPLLKSTKIAFDAIYGKQTPFLKLAKENNINIADGSSMLVWQAVYAFEKFINKNIDYSQISQIMFKAIKL